MNEPMFRLEEDRFGARRRRFASFASATSESAPRADAPTPAAIGPRPLAAAVASAS